MPDRGKVIKGLECCTFILGKRKCNECPYLPDNGCYQLQDDFHTLLKEQEAAKPKAIPEELKLKMWNALYAEEDKLEEKYIGTKEQNSWFLIYRPWLQEGFNLAIKIIADWEGV